MAIQKGITDHFIYSVIVKQILGLELERDALLIQVRALVEEKELLYKIIEKLELKIEDLDNKSNESNNNLD